MTEKSDAYEEFVGNLVREIKGSGHQISEIQCGRKNLILGRSGHKHQVDVSFVDSIDDKPVLVLIECKNWKENVSNDVVKVLFATMYDIAQHSDTRNVVKGIIVSANGFQSGAYPLAAEWDIKLQEVSKEPPFDFVYESYSRHSLVDQLEMSQECSVVVSKPGK